MSSLSATATGAIITADNGALVTITPAGSAAWAIGSTTVTAGQLYTLSDSQIFSADSTDLHLDGTPITTSALGPVPASATTGIAVLADSNHTVTAYQVPGNTLLGVVNGSTLSYRGPGMTASDGEVVSLVWNGIAGSTTTALFSSLPGGVQPSSPISAPTLTSSASMSSNGTTVTGGTGNSSVLSTALSNTTSALTTTSTNAAGSAVTSTIIVTNNPSAGSSSNAMSSSNDDTPSAGPSTLTSTEMMTGAAATAVSPSQANPTTSASGASASMGLQSSGSRPKPAWAVIVGFSLIRMLLAV